MKVVINVCYGGFSLSHEAIMRYWEIKDEPIYFSDRSAWITHYFTKDVDPNDEKLVNETYWSDREIPRDDPILIQVVEELKEVADGSCARLKVVEIPDGVDWIIDEYDGYESVDEEHRSWS